MAQTEVCNFTGLSSRVPLQCFSETIYLARFRFTTLASRVSETFTANTEHIQLEKEAHSSGQQRRSSVKLTTHLYLVPGLRIRQRLLNSVFMPSWRDAYARDKFTFTVFLYLFIPRLRSTPGFLQSYENIYDFPSTKGTF